MKRYTISTSYICLNWKFIQCCRPYSYASSRKFLLIVSIWLKLAQTRTPQRPLSKVSLSPPPAMFSEHTLVSFTAPVEKRRLIICFCGDVVVLTINIFFQEFKLSHLLQGVVERYYLVMGGCSSGERVGHQPFIRRLVV